MPARPLVALLVAWYAVAACGVPAPAKAVSAAGAKPCGCPATAAADCCCAKAAAGCCSAKPAAKTCCAKTPNEASGWVAVGWHAATCHGAAHGPAGLLTPPPAVPAPPFAVPAQPDAGAWLPAAPPCPVAVPVRTPVPPPKPV